MKRLIGIVLLLISCSATWIFYDPLQYLAEPVEPVGFDHAAFLDEIDRAEAELLQLWLDNQRRPAQSRLVVLHETLKPVFEHLYDDHHHAVIAAEHQIGWVLHRLRYAPSKSKKREQAYLKNLSQHLKDCIELLPERTIAPEELVEEPEAEAVPPQPDALNVVLSRTGQ